MNARTWSFPLLILALLLGCAACEQDPDTALAPQKTPDTSAAPDSSAAPEADAPDSAGASGDPEVKSEPRDEAVQASAETWVLESYGPPTSRQAPVANSKITAVFSEGSIQGSAGCNTYSAPVEREGEKLKIGGPIATRKFCSIPGVMEQEAAFLEALTTVATSKTEGDTLTLTNGAGAKMIFKRPEKKAVEEQKQ